MLFGHLYLFFEEMSVYIMSLLLMTEVIPLQRSTDKVDNTEGPREADLRGWRKAEEALRTGRKTYSGI